jgi:hypothetical protein
MYVKFLIPPILRSKVITNDKRLHRPIAYFSACLITPGGESVTEVTLIIIAPTGAVVLETRFEDGTPAFSHSRLLSAIVTHRFGVTRSVLTLPIRI